MFLKTFIFIVTPLFLPPTLWGQSNLTLLNSRSLPSETKALILEGKVVGYWGKDQVVLQNNRVRISKDEQVISVLPFSNGTDTNLLVITTENGSIPGKVNVLYRSLDPSGSVIARWSQTQSNDAGLPEIHLFADNFIFLHPEDQTVEIFSLAGEKIHRHTLFPHSRWNHERKLIYLPNNNGKPTLIGMASVNLAEPQNVHLLQIDSPYQIQLKTKVPLTIPYLADRSAKGRLLIVGTQSSGNPEEQLPYLLVYDSQYQPLLEPYRLPEMPYFAHWWQDEVLLVFPNYSLLLDPNSSAEKKTISSHISTFPLFTTVIGNRCYLFASNKIQYQSQGLRYQGLQCQIIDLQTATSQMQVLTPETYTRVFFFPSGEEQTLGIQLEEQVYFYDLK